MGISTIAATELTAAHHYVCELLEDFDPSLWFRQPAEGVTHVAWQVGHIAMAEYNLCCRRLRGNLPTDEQVLPAAFIKYFGRGTLPEADAALYPSPAEIRAVLDRVHQHVLQEVGTYSDAQLAEPQLGAPHPYFTTKQGALFWCVRHEMLHAGKIGLIKRLLGLPPKW